ncbi:Uncharacterised protein [Klebsiella pneumoniae]|nr:Uncharacterised protein [Klebsiella pneumoniae]
MERLTAFGLWVVVAHLAQFDSLQAHVRRSGSAFQKVWLGGGELSCQFADTA